MKKVLLTIAASLSANLYASCELGAFTHNANKGGTQYNLALVDSSEISLKWLLKNSDTLKAKKVLIMMIDGDKEFIKKLSQKKTDKNGNVMKSPFDGLLIGPAPKPYSMIPKLCEKFSIKNYPAVVENGVTWQIEPPSIKKAELSKSLDAANESQAPSKPQNTSRESDAEKAIRLYDSK